MKHLDLFSGIGGFALAARNVGWETIGFCEIDPWCQKILAKHWPGVPIYEDVCDVTAERLRADGVIWAETGSSTELNAVADTASADAGCRERFAEGQKPVNGQSSQFLSDASRGGGTTKAGRDNRLVLTGGFPCQDISHAGKQAGIEGERSGLWSELARVIGEVRPRYAVLENVSALLSGDRGRWFQRVLGDLAEIGYDCEWHCIPASAVGAPHQRDRVWIVAYPNGCEQGRRQQQKRRPDQRDTDPAGNGAEGDVAYPQEQSIRTGLCEDEQAEVGRRRPCNGSGKMADTNKPRLEGRLRKVMRQRAGKRSTRESGDPWDGNWQFEPNVGRVANGIPRRVDRLRGLGNAIVPACAEVIFRAINENQTLP